MKRIISLVLSLVIILSLVCVAAPSVSAASAFKTSNMLVEMIKQFEGFKEWPYKHGDEWYIGYGSRISADKLAYYNAYGITIEEATKLLKEYVAGFEESVNDFADANNLKLTQQKFDALVCFTYNLGPSWMNETDGLLRNAVINGATGNDFIFAIAQFCKADGQVQGGLVKRRLSEANLYLNGVYSIVAPVNYKYVIFNSNLEGAFAFRKGTDKAISVQAYDTTRVTEVKADAAKSGYRFLGWYTKDEGGEWITSLSLKTASNTELYGHWQNGDGERNEDGTIKGVPAQYSGYIPAGADATVYEAPQGAAVKTVKGDVKLNVVAEYMDASGIKWGQLKNGGWIKITAPLATAPVYEDPASVIDPIVVTVITSGVNNRVGPGTNYPTQGKFTKGQQLILTAVQKGGNHTWGKSEMGWIALQYTDYELVISGDSGSSGEDVVIGTIIRADRLNIRSAPGVHNAKVGTYKRGDLVKISLQQKVGNTMWGMTDKGWISMYYVQLIETGSGNESDTEVPGGSGTPDNTTVIASGKIVKCDTLRIRAAAGTQHAIVGKYTKGSYVNIYEIVKVGSAKWGRTSKGWISLYYVALDAAATGEGITGRIVNCTSVNVRAGAGTNYAAVGKLNKGTKVEILEYVKLGSAYWGRISQGWVHLYYVKLDAPLSTLDKTEDPKPGEGSSGSEPGKIVASGAFGEKQAWNLDSKGTLTISGTGPMEDFNKGDAVVPWHEHRNSIITVKIESGVTSIGNSVFQNSSKLTTVVVPDSVTSIGSFTFQNCTSLKNINIPAGVEHIYLWAFAGCSSLTNIVIPDGVESIGYNVFNGCKSLSKITFKGDAPSMCEDTFTGVTATAYYPADNTTWTADVMQNYGGTITWTSGAPAEGDGGSGSGSGSGSETPETPEDSGETGVGLNVTFDGYIKGADSIRIRAAAGTHNAEVGSYKKGTRVTIQDIAYVGNATWGRTNKGWISLYYVMFDGTTNVEGVVVRTIKASSLTVRADATTDSKSVGTYKSGHVVIVYEQVKNEETGDIWGLTDKGWISMKYTK